MTKSHTSTMDVHSVAMDDEQWYTAGDAAKVLTANSGRTIGPEYPYKLGALEKVRVKKINPRITFYHKGDIDSYKVEPRGVRSGAAKRARYGIPAGAPTVREQRRQKAEAKQGDWAA